MKNVSEVSDFCTVINMNNFVFADKISSAYDLKQKSY